MSSRVKKSRKQQVFPHCTPTHMTDDISTHHKPHFPEDPKCFQAFSQQHGAIHRGAFRHGAHGDARVRQQENRGGAWCAGGDNEALAAEAALGRRQGVAQHRATAWCGGWFVPYFSCYLSHIARIVMCASRLFVHGCEKERVRAAALINAWISVDPCCTVASVRKRLQASGIERSRRRSSDR